MFPRESTEINGSNLGCESKVWFRDTKQLNNVKTSEGHLEVWFHGLISRTAAEEILKGRCVGSFLVRVSQSRFGYSLSFKGTSRCYHIAIDQKGSLYVAVGDDRASFRSLRDLIIFYKRHPVVADGYVLTDAVGQWTPTSRPSTSCTDSTGPYTSQDYNYTSRSPTESRNGNKRDCPDTVSSEKMEEPIENKPSRSDIIRWFRRTQMSPLMKKQGGFYSWFYGLVSKSKAELMLKDKDPGCFFVRVCEDQLMLCLSMKGGQKKVKHFDIDYLPNKKYQVIGEIREFKSMNNLIQYYKMYPISAFGDRLKEVGCREGHVIDFTDLLDEVLQPDS
ncbi:hypothetical protein BSL78_22067 [Apostichopus japonicus]|uniref:SH2 domain-containing protein n=1 Tax=Stichopus japonicus TaxID=307972 RepID=A0A2G8JZB5_STIJA|nr:hypothetical protein BSL78_22067 [Apostichopus japonicus]